MGSKPFTKNVYPALWMSNVNSLTTNPVSTVKDSGHKNRLLTMPSPWLPSHLFFFFEQLNFQTLI